MVKKPVAIQEDPKINYNQLHSSPYQGRIISVNIGSKSYSIHEDYLRRHPRLSDIYGGLVTSLDVDEDIGHTIVHFLYTGEYETLRAGSIQDDLIAREMRRSVQAYYAARVYGLTGLEAFAKVYIKQFSESVSVFDLLQEVRSIFSKLPVGEVWLPSHIDARLAKEYERDENIFEDKEFCNLFGEEKNFDKAILRMVINIYSSRLSSLQRQVIKQKNESGAATEEPPIAEESTPAKAWDFEVQPTEECLPDEELAPVEEKPMPYVEWGFSRD
ncbi:hypothetical protein MaudCBS49596_006665 [Microsporum audouinii]